MNNFRVHTSFFPSIRTNMRSWLENAFLARNVIVRSNQRVHKNHQSLAIVKGQRCVLATTPDVPETWQGWKERERERVWRVQGEETRRCTGSRFTFDPWKTRETCSCVTQIVNETFRRLNNGSPLRIRERIKWSKVALNRGKRFARSFAWSSSNRKVVHFFF